jgi:putative ABC transport system permease protein
MSIGPRIVGILRRLVGRVPADRDPDEETRGNCDTQVGEHVAGGESLDDPSRQAQPATGGVEQAKEPVRAVRPVAWLETFSRDLQYSVRLLAKTPGTSLTAVLVLALGIGANAAVFSLVNVLLFKPMPGDGLAGQVVLLHTHDPSKPDSYRPFTYREYEDVRDHAGVFDQLMAHSTTAVAVTDGGTARRSASLVTANYFETLGATLARGRLFTSEEERPGSGAAVMILSHAGWRRLGAPADILGRTIVVNAHPFTVVGVAPEWFTGTLPIVGPDFWMPIGADTLLSGGQGRAPGTPAVPRPPLLIVGRLKPGGSLESAAVAMRALSATLDQARPGSGDRQLITVSRRWRLQQGYRPMDHEDEVALPLGALMAAALIVLVIAGLNVANVLLARGAARRKEMAMRLALGAGRARVVAQLLTESALLSVAAGVVGLVLAFWTMRLVVVSLGSVVEKSIEIDVMPDWRVCLAWLIFCGLAAVASGIGPAWRLSGLDLLSAMKGREGAGPGRASRRLGPRNLLVAGQVALSLALLAAAGLFVRAAVTVGQADPGYRFDRQLLLRVDATAGGYDEASGREAYARLMDRLRSEPGVESAAMTSTVAFSNSSVSCRVRRANERRASEAGVAGGTVALSYAVGASYFRTLGLSMLRGREFTDAEEVDPRPSDVVIIDEPLAAAMFPGRDALGEMVLLSGTDTRPRQVVGVAPGLRQDLRDRVPVSHVYLPIGSQYEGAVSVHVRVAASGPAAVDRMRGQVREAVAAAGTRLGVLSVLTLDEARDELPLNWLVRAAGRTFGAFGLIAVLMATTGLYGVKAFLGSQRTREIGVRMALGAKPADVRWMMLREGAALLAAGVAVGILLALAVGRAIGSLLVGVQPFDPVVLLVATFVLSAAVLAACYLPARRATRTSPVTALRAE